MFSPVLVLAINAQAAALIIGAIIFLIVALSIVGLLHATLEGIYSAAVYQYATTGQVGAFFDERLVRGAFVPSGAY